mgnify:CR=1 FL=1
MYWFALIRAGFLLAILWRAIRWRAVLWPVWKLALLSRKRSPSAIQTSVVCPACCMLKVGLVNCKSHVTVRLGAKKPGFFMPEAPSSYEKLQLTSTDWLVDG